MSANQVDDPALSDKIAELRQKKKEDLTLAERITLNAADQRITVDISGIPVECRAPLVAEISEFEKHLKSGKYDEILRKIADLCIDDSITFEFLASGMMTNADIQNLVAGICGVDEATLKRLERFRNK